MNYKKKGGRTGPFLLSNGTTFFDDLHSQRKVVDEKLYTVKNYLENHRNRKLQETMENAFILISSLQEKRKAIDAFKLTPYQSLLIYNEIIGSLLDSIQSLVSKSINREIYNHLDSYRAIIQKKEYLGLERAVLSKVFYLDTFNEELKKTFYSVRKAQEVYTQQFLSTATPQQKLFFSNKMQGTAVNEVARIHKIIEEKEEGRNFGIDASTWFTTVTGVINLLKEIEDKIAGDLMKKQTDCCRTPMKI